MPITALPTSPQPSDSPAIFNTKAFNLLGALPTFVTEANALEAENAAAAAAAANAVLVSKTTGPASSTDNALARFDGATGKLLQGSGVVVDDSGNLLVNSTTPDAGFGKQVKVDDTNYPALVLKSTAATNGRQYVLGLDNTTFAPSVFKLRESTSIGDIFVFDPATSTFLFRAGTFGYGVGAGGTVTQPGNKGATVTLNKPSGQITMSNAALSAGEFVGFALSNTHISASDSVVVTINRAANGASYNTWVYYTGSGVTYIALKNVSGGSLSDAVVLNFAVIKGSTT